MDTYEHKLKYDKRGLIYFSHQKESDELLDIYRKVALENKDFVFYNTNEEDIIQNLNDKKSSLIYYNYGNYTSHFEGEFSYENVSNFLKGIIEKTTYLKFDDDTIEAVFMKRKPTLFFIRNRFMTQTQMFEKKRLPQIVSKYKDRLQFVVMDIDGKKESKLAEFFGIKNSDLPVAKILDWKNNKPRKFSLAKTINSQTMVSFINNWKEGNYNYNYYIYQNLDRSSPEPNVRSQEYENEDKENKDMFKGIGFNAKYEKISFNQKNSVMFYYTDWCSICKKVIIKT